MKRQRVCLLFLLCLPFESSATASAQTDASWVESARKEGHVVFYASMEAQSAQRLVTGFEKKYPFIKVDATRIGS